MEIQNAQMEQLRQIEAVYAQARAFMARTGNPNQWGTTNPTRETLEGHIRRSELYTVVQDGEICGCFAFIPGEDPTYGSIDGSWHSDAPYAAIHCVASNGRVKGMFSRLLQFCEARCPYLRIDTYRDNHIMQHVVTKHGFSYCGTIYLADGSPRMAYDRTK